MALIAVISSSFILVLGALVTLREAGYAFDLRRNGDRRVPGGRRVSDR